MTDTSRQKDQRADTRIEQLINEIADAVFPPIFKGDTSTIIHCANPILRDLLGDFAKEIQRASIEGEW